MLKHEKQICHSFPRYSSRTFLCHFFNIVSLSTKSIFMASMVNLDSTVFSYSAKLVACKPTLALVSSFCISYSSGSVGDLWSSLSISGRGFPGKIYLKSTCSAMEMDGTSNVDRSMQSRRTILHDLYEKCGQSAYYDNLCRPVTNLLPLISSGIRGVTSNPAIFEKSITSSNAYDEHFRRLIEEGKDVESAYWELVVHDIREACKLLKPIYDKDGLDGHVSVPVSPRLADDTEATIEAARSLHEIIGYDNVYVKIPATDESIPSIKHLISKGISINVTLIFSLPRYEAVVDAYLEGLEACELADLSKVSSAAAFYVSRVDLLVDSRLQEIGTVDALDLRGKAAVAQAVLAYQLFHKKFSGPRWEALAKRGAKKQRLMWASTNVKNPSYPDTTYVASLIGPETISTMPEQALEAFMDHGVVSRTIDANVSEAQEIYNAIEKLGMDWELVGKQLEHEVMDSFNKCFDRVLNRLQDKATKSYRT